MEAGGVTSNPECCTKGQEPCGPEAIRPREWSLWRERFLLCLGQEPDCTRSRIGGWSGSGGRSVLLFPVKEGTGHNGNWRAGQAWSQTPCPEEEMEMGAGLDQDLEGPGLFSLHSSCLLLRAPAQGHIRRYLCKASSALPYHSGSHPPLSSRHCPGSVCCVASAHSVMMQ